jgi:hypothetical protein
MTKQYSIIYFNNIFYICFYYIKKEIFFKFSLKKELNIKVYFAMLDFFFLKYFVYDGI